MNYYAIGDIHGRDDLLEILHQRIIFDPHRKPDSLKPTVVHIGDYIDGSGGKDSDKVIDRLIRGSQHFNNICLLGNHEALMLDCLETDDRDTWWNWLSNGGETTLSSLGVSVRFGGYDPRALAEGLGEQRIAWLKSLPLYHLAEPYLFVHAGIVPNMPLQQQKRKDLLWIRSRFLDSDIKHEYIVVHGHTPTETPELLHNRINIDTGAARPKTLTAVALSKKRTPRFMSASL